MHEHAWGIILASGRERRLGVAMLRMARLLPLDRVVAVVRRGQGPQLGGAAPAQVLEEPDDHGPLAPVLVAALHVQERDPHAVLIATESGLPEPDRRGLASLELACLRAGHRESGVLVREGNPAPLLVARPETLLRRVVEALPEAMPWLETYRQVLRVHEAGRAGHEDLAVARTHLYSRLPRAGFSLLVRGAAPRGAAPHRSSAKRRRSLRPSASSGLSTLH